MVLWQHVMLCGNVLLRVQLAGFASYADDDLKKSKHVGVILIVFKCFYVEFM